MIAAHLLARKHGWEESPVYGIELNEGILERALLWIEHHTGYRRELLKRDRALDAKARAWRQQMDAMQAEFAREPAEILEGGLTDQP